MAIANLFFSAMIDPSDYFHCIFGCGTFIGLIPEQSQDWVLERLDGRGLSGQGCTTYTYFAQQVQQAVVVIILQRLAVKATL